MENELLISEAIELQLLDKKHVDELFQLVDTNREHLREWLPWINANTSPTDTESFVSSAISQHESGKGPQYAVFYEATMCGVCGFHPFDVTNKIGGIGYWLSQAYIGKGIMTSSVKALIGTGFQEYGLNRIEVACATGNGSSRAIPERLGFTLEGELREREYLYGRYVDHAIYSMLASEFLLRESLNRAG
ncbi:GNAT family N-acetyltransferase [Chromohalobacter israelensis]|uniref:GNAT family N-acetyltransferase n=1 Tax=Chromohalobacter israelensis TaxID=141390 RepID=UPI000FFE8B19|nr:GNAT family N-acetyltransferase [Chromohalobacter salexigens]RXE49288.1 GNAT family N-acetyltransferase [Chromohalobacter salexigens]